MRPLLKKNFPGTMLIIMLANFIMVLASFLIFDLTGYGKLVFSFIGIISLFTALSFLLEILRNKKERIKQVVLIQEDSPAAPGTSQGEGHKVSL